MDTRKNLRVTKHMTGPTRVQCCIYDADSGARGSTDQIAQLAGPWSYG